MRTAKTAPLEGVRHPTRKTWETEEPTPKNEGWGTRKTFSQRKFILTLNARV